MTSDGDRLLAAIIDNPDEDLPRLIYADWLEENGEVDRAEFIRLMIEWHPVPWEQIARQAEERIRLLRRKFCPHGVGLPLVNDDLDGCGSYTWRRGFIDTITTTFQQALDHLPAIVRRHPLRPHTGMVTDRRPLAEPAGSATWYDGSKWRSIRGADVLPGDVFAHLPKPHNSGITAEFKTIEAAMLALAVAMIAQAREANLTPKEVTA